jgi:hypothetical protein
MEAVPLLPKYYRTPFIDLFRGALFIRKISSLEELTS